MAPPTAIKYAHVPQRLCVMASTSRQNSSKATVALRLGFYNQRLGKGTLTENQGGQSSSGGCGVNSVNGHLGDHEFPTTSHDEVTISS